MPIEYTFSHKFDVVYARHYGLITLDQLMANFATYLSDPDYKPGRPELIDLSDGVHAELGVADAARLLSKVNAQGGGVPVQTLTSVWAPTDRAFGMARMYAALAAVADGIEVHVTRAERTALFQLGLPHATVAELLSSGEFSGGTMHRVVPAEPPRKSR